MTKRAHELQDFMRTVNGSDEPEDGRNRPVLLREFVDQIRAVGWRRLKALVLDSVSSPQTRMRAS